MQIHSTVRLACYYTHFTAASECRVDGSLPQQENDFLDNGNFASMPAPVLRIWLSVLNMFINGYYGADAQC